MYSTLILGLQANLYFISKVKNPFLREVYYVTQTVFLQYLSHLLTELAKILHVAIFLHCT